MGSNLVVFGMTYLWSDQQLPSLEADSLPLDLELKESLERLAASELNMHDLGQLEKVEKKGWVGVEPAVIFL